MFGSIFAKIIFCVYFCLNKEKMKRFFTSLTAAAVLVAALASCGISYSGSSSSASSSPSSSSTTQITRQNEEQLQVTTRVLKALSARDLRITVNQAYSSTGQAIALGSGYEIRIHDGQIDSRLPFYGSSTRASVSGDVSIVFEKAPMRDYSEDNSKALNGKFVRTFRADGADGEYTLTLTVWDNARTESTCQNPDRTQMRYAGELLLD